MRSSTASANLFIFVASILSLSTASGQTAPAGRFPRAARKIRDAAGCPDLSAGDFAANDLAVSVLYQLPGERRRKWNNIVGDAANEPSIAVDPTDGNKMTIGWRQFDTWTPNFRQGGWGYTTDAGITWHFPAFGKQCFPQRSGDKLRRDRQFFYLSLLVNTFCGDIWRSTNGGQTGRDCSRRSCAQR